MTDPETLEKLLTGTVGAIGVLSVWVRQLIVEKKQDREHLLKELDKRNDVIERKDSELSEVTKDSIGCITQITMLFEHFQESLQRFKCLKEEEEKKN